MEILHAKKLAEQKIAEHKINYSVEFSNSKTYLGQCDRIKKVILLSRHFIEINSEEIMTNTILHEIAHALTPGHGHDAMWRKVCREIGARPERVNRICVSPKMKYTVSCDVHGEIGQARSPRNQNIKTHYCLKCWREKRIKNYTTYKLN